MGMDCTYPRVRLDNHEMDLILLFVKPNLNLNPLLRDEANSGKIYPTLYSSIALDTVTVTLHIHGLSSWFLFKSPRLTEMQFE